jgi:hypothetical protein
MLGFLFVVVLAGFDTFKDDHWGSKGLHGFRVLCAARKEPLFHRTSAFSVFRSLLGCVARRWVRVNDMGLHMGRPANSLRTSRPSFLGQRE